MSRPLIRHLLALAGGVALTGISWLLGWLWLTWLAGAYVALAVDATCRATLQSLAPATRRERRLANRVNQAARRGVPPTR